MSKFKSSNTLFDISNPPSQYSHKLSKAVFILRLK